MFKRPLIWILGIWILGEMGAAYLGLNILPETTLDNIMQSREEETLPVVVVGKVLTLSEKTYGLQAEVSVETLELQDGADPFDSATSSVRVDPSDSTASSSRADSSDSAASSALTDSYDVGTSSIHTTGALKTRTILVQGANGLSETDMEQLLPGNRVELRGELKIFAEAANPGEFDLREYYRNLGIDYSLKADRIRLISEPVIPYGDLVWKVKQRFLEVIGSIAGDADEAGIFTALMLGDKSDLSDETYSLMQTAGVAHILAVSGLHLTIIGAGLWKLLRKLGLHRVIAGICADLVLLVYVLFIDGGASAWRALIMFTVMLGANAAGRTYDLLSALGLAGILMLADRPLLAFSSGFQLSFAAIFGVGLLYPIFEKKLRAINRRRTIQQLPVSQGFQNVIRSFCFSLSIQLMSLPVTAWHFYTFSLYGIFLNLIVIPLMSAALISVMAGTLTGLISIPFGTFCAGTAHYIFTFMLWLCGLAAKLPAATLVIGRPEPWQILLYYGILAFLLLCLDKRFWLAFLCVLVLVPLPKGGLSVTALYVGQGDGLVLELPGYGACLVDGGSSDRKNVGKNVICAYLKYQGISRVEMIFLSHPDTDHVSGLTDILADEAIRVGGIAISDAGSDWTEILSLAESYDVPVYHVSAGDEILLSRGKVELEVLYPAEGRKARAGGSSPDEAGNEASMVLKLSYDDVSMLFTGDIGADAERSVDWPDVDILKVQHHGSKNGCTEAFLEQAQPETAIISAGIGNSYGHPHEETLRRLNAAGAAVYRTDQLGAVTIEIRDGSYAVW